MLTPPANPSLLAAPLGLVGLLIRGAAAGYLHKGQTLASTGPYARTRNPLYFGSGFLAGAFGVASHSWLAAALLLVFFGVTYYAVMRKEEAELRVRYSPEFDAYERRVPLFWPRLGAAGSSAGGNFSWPQYLRNREYQAGIGAAAADGCLWRDGPLGQVENSEAVKFAGTAGEGGAKKNATRRSSHSAQRPAHRRSHFRRPHSDFLDRGNRCARPAR